MSKFKLFLKNLKYMCNQDLSKPPFSLVDLTNGLLYFIPNSSVVRPNVLDCNKTLELLCTSQKSLARFGDGEIAIINGGNAVFQKYDERLARRMREILKNQNDNLSVGINYWYFWPETSSRKTYSDLVFVLSKMPRFRKDLMPLLDFSSVYCDAGISGIRYEKNEESEAQFKKLKSIWDGRDVVLVGCRQAQLKLKFNIFENAASETWVYVPNIDAFDQYDEILEQIKQYPKDSLVILMAGPTGKVLAYDLSNDGYRALDLGHVAKSYDLYMRGIPLTDEVEQDFWAPDL